MLETREAGELQSFIDLLNGYANIALIANSEGLKIDAVVSALPANTLFVFFTGCAKVLHKPFPHDAILCHRLVADGKRFLKAQKHFDSAHSFFPQDLKMEVGIIADKKKINGVKPLPPGQARLFRQ